MEMSLYQDESTEKTQELKRNMFLDLASGNTKEQKIQSLLASPDLKMLKLGSPEIEKMLLAQNSMVAGTPTPTQFIYPKYVTDEQEAYARGFVEALAHLHGTIGEPQGASGSQVSEGTSVTDSKDSTATSTYCTLMPMGSVSTATAANNIPMTSANTQMSTGDNMPRLNSFVPTSLADVTKPSVPVYGSVNVKEEPSSSYLIDQTVPHSPSPSSRITDSPVGSPESATFDHVNGDQLDNLPVNMEEQEKIKLERKRARNRIAARKCRTRKLEHIARLEEKVNALKSKNNELTQTATSLNQQVSQLRQQIIDHMKSGCHIILPDMHNNMSAM